MSIARYTVVARGAGRRASAMSLLEVMLALAILTIVSTAVCALTFGAMNADRFSRSSSTAQSEVELAMRRIAGNVKEAQSVTIVGSTLTTLTQPDAIHGFPAGANVIYSLVADPANAGQQVLTENDQRYGTNTLVHNVGTFAVLPIAGTPGLYQVDLVANGQMTVERHFRVYCRN